MVMQWAICIRQPYVQCIVDGVKAYEIRTGIPERLSVGDEVYVVQDGSGGNVVLSFIVEDIILDAPKNIWEHFEKELCVGKEDFYLYAAGRMRLYLLKIGFRKIFSPPLKLSDLGLYFTPQWFVQVHVPDSAPLC